MPDLDFDANEFEPASSFDPIPEGDYLVVITASDLKLTAAAKESGNKEDGEYLELTLQVIEGPHQNRLLWDRLNLKNRNETTVKIAKGALSAICHAVGRMQPKRSEELHNIPLVAKVVIEKRKDTGGLTNKVKGYKSAKPEEASEPKTPTTAQASKPQPSTVPAGPGRRKAPWEK